MKKRSLVHLRTGILTAALAVILGIGAMSFDSYADEGTDFNQEAVIITGQVVELPNDAKAYAAPDESSEMKVAFSAGEPVYVLTEKDGWYEIFYQGENLFIKGDILTQEAMEEAEGKAQEQAKALAAEFEENEQQNQAVMEAYDRQQQTKNNSLIWKIVIAALVVAILVVSVIIAVKNKKDDEPEE